MRARASPGPMDNGGDNNIWSFGDSAEFDNKEDSTIPRTTTSTTVTPWMICLMKTITAPSLPRYQSTRTRIRPKSRLLLWKRRALTSSNNIKRVQTNPGDEFQVTSRIWGGGSEIEAVALFCLGRTPTYIAYSLMCILSTFLLLPANDRYLPCVEILYCLHPMVLS